MNLYHQVPDCDFYVGNVLDVCAALPAKSVHTICTSPPYWNLRDYKIPPSVWGGDPSCDHNWETTIIPAANGIIHSGGMSGETLSGNSATRKPRESHLCRTCGACLSVLGLEKLHDCLGWAKGETCSQCFICHMRLIARALWRVLRDDGTFFCNIGDSYAGSGKGPTGHNGIGDQGQRQGFTDRTTSAQGLKAKDRVGIPERFALALQADGWTWRDTIHLCKTSPMPESVRDRTTQAHEPLFLFTKRAKYYYDADAVREPQQSLGERHEGRSGYREGHSTSYGFNHRELNPLGRNPRSWMLVSPEPSSLHHYATFVGGRTIPSFALRTGTSEYGVCGACGAPWQRVTEKTATGRVRERSGGGLGTAIRREPLGLAPVMGSFQEGVAYRTTGWRPSCTCDVPFVPATVFDPFSGSGSTQVVARELGRRSIYCDLSGKYADMAIKRLSETNLALPMPQTLSEAAQQLTFAEERSYYDHEAQP